MRIQEYSFYLKSIKLKFEMPEIFKWKPIGRYVSGSPLLDIMAYFRATSRCTGFRYIHVFDHINYKPIASFFDDVIMIF